MISNAQQGKGHQETKAFQPRESLTFSANFLSTFTSALYNGLTNYIRKGLVFAILDAKHRDNKQKTLNSSCVRNSGKKEMQETNLKLCNVHLPSFFQLYPAALL